MKPRLLDLFCGAGGAAKGYQMAGFYVVGVDNRPRPHYCGDEFHQADALEFCREHGQEFDVIHASPPCQRYSICTGLAYKENHPDLIEVTRECLGWENKPYVIENVSGARHLLHHPVMLCGTMFGLMNLQRHRYFEIFPLWMARFAPATCNHSTVPVLVTGTTRRHPRRENVKSEKAAAIGIDWMTTTEMDEAIPPAYTFWIGKHLIQHINSASPTGCLIVRRSVPQEGS